MRWPFLLAVTWKQSISHSGAGACGDGGGDSSKDNNSTRVDLDKNTLLSPLVGLLSWSPAVKPFQKDKLPHNRKWNNTADCWRWSEVFLQYFDNYSHRKSLFQRLLTFAWYSPSCVCVMETCGDSNWSTTCCSTEAAEWVFNFYLFFPVLSTAICLRHKLQTRTTVIQYLPISCWWLAER